MAQQLWSLIHRTFPMVSNCAVHLCGCAGQPGVHLGTYWEPDLLDYGHIVKHKGQFCIFAMASITGHGECFPWYLHEYCLHQGPLESAEPVGSSMPTCMPWAATNRRKFTENFTWLLPASTRACCLTPSLVNSPHGFKTV